MKDWVCLQGATRFSSSLTEAANSLHGGIELQKPEQQYVDSIELKAAAFSRAANDEAVLQHFNQVSHLHDAHPSCCVSHPGPIQAVKQIVCRRSYSYTLAICWMPDGCA